MTAMSFDPPLPPTFGETFTHHDIETDDLRLHAVVGGEGPPILLVHGWPQTWYAWRYVMPALARSATVVAVDNRGAGQSGKPPGGYDTGTLAVDLVALMERLGHRRFSVAGHDVGMWIGYAIAADHPDQVERLAVLEAVLPGVSPSPPLLGTRETNRRLWHFGFNRLPGEVNEALVRGREDVYFGNQFATKTAPTHPLPEVAVRHYVEILARDADALRASFEYYRHLDLTIAQNHARLRQSLTMPILAVGGALSTGELVAQTMRRAATDVTESIIPDCGHYPAEERPDETIAALLRFFT
jgi:pimeloyl-ACP methyl ester carboxylesterase